MCYLFCSMDNSSLKEQFKLLQEQKKKRLIKKNERKLENNNNTKLEQEHRNETISDKFNDIEDDLDLKLPNLLSGGCIDIRGTDDYKDLLETLRELRDENGRLEKLLAEKDEEVKIVRRRWKAEREELAGGGPASGNAASKIIEFSKKIRELTTNIEKEKNKSSLLEKKLSVLEKKSIPEIKSPPSKTEIDLLNDGLSTMKAKYDNVQMKCVEGKSEIDSLKKEIKIAQKVLLREVGDNVTFQSLLNGSSGWRGRQQQILALQLKITDLQQQVDASQGNSNSSRNALLNGISQHDEKHRLAMRKIELERKEQQDKLQKELISITAERDSYKEKNNAARARNKIITQDLKNLKDQLSTMIEKGKHDDELVSALLREQQLLKEGKEKIKSELISSKAQNERVVRASSSFSSDNDNLVKMLKDKIRDQEERVKELELEIGHLRNARNNRPTQSLIPRPLSSSSRSNTALGNLDLINNQISSNQLLQENKSLHEATKIEKEKLGELVKVLQRRTEELGKQLLEKNFTINEFKNANASLQKRIEKYSLTKSNSMERNISGTKNSKKKNVETCITEVEEMETKLCIQMDNNDALKSALEETLRAKEEDSKYFHQMIEQTKNIFLQGLRQYREANASNYMEPYTYRDV